MKSYQFHDLLKKKPANYNQIKSNTFWYLYNSFTSYRLKILPNIDVHTHIPGLSLSTPIKTSHHSQATEWRGEIVEIGLRLLCTIFYNWSEALVRRV